MKGSQWQSERNFSKFSQKRTNSVSMEAEIKPQRRFGGSIPGKMKLSFVQWLGISFWLLVSQGPQRAYFSFRQDMPNLSSPSWWSTLDTS